MDSILTVKDVLRFSALLHEMDVPKERMDDLDWLDRNLHIRNKEHPNYEEANNLLDKLLRNTNGL
jgi:hypothetical protein